MSDNPPTPDAIRAAIERALSDAHHAGYTAAWVEYGMLTDADNKAATERATKSRQHLIAQIGAVPAAGSVTFQRTRDIPSDDGHIHSFVWDSNSGMYCDTCGVRLHFVLANGADGGAVPAAGTVTVSREDAASLLKATLHVIASIPSNAPSFHWWLSIRDKLKAALANGAGDGGA